MDSINILNNEVRLDESLFGEAYTYSRTKDGTLNAKYKIYKDLPVNERYGFLSLTINEKGRGFKVRGSIRKWWFGNRSTQDFDYLNFVQCIEKLAIILGIEKTQLWESRVTYLEIGGNIRLDRKYAFVIPCMVSFPRLQKVNYGNESTVFKSINRTLIAYDKIREIFNHKNENKKIGDKLRESIFIMRFEIKLKTPSGTTLNDKVKTLYGVRNNWDFLIDYWLMEWNKIVCLKFLKPKPSQSREFMTRKELGDYGFAIAIQEIGLDYFNSIIDTSFRRNHKSQEKKILIEICKRCKVDGSSKYKEDIDNAVKTKAEKMKRRSREL